MRRAALRAGPRLNRADLGLARPGQPGDQPSGHLPISRLRDLDRAPGAAGVNRRSAASAPYVLAETECSRRPANREQATAHCPRHEGRLCWAEQHARPYQARASRLVSNVHAFGDAGEVGAFKAHASLLAK
jgi:hypothetical protein